MACWKHMVSYAIFYKHISPNYCYEVGKSEGRFFSFQIQPISTIATIYTSGSVSVTYLLTISDYLIY